MTGMILECGGKIIFFKFSTFYSNWCWQGTKGTWFAGGEGKHGRVKLVLRCYEPVWKRKFKGTSLHILTVWCSDILNFGAICQGNTSTYMAL